MTRVRIAGPRALLDRTLHLLQDLEVVHVVRPPIRQLHAPRDRETRRLRRALEDDEAALRCLGVSLSANTPRAASVSLPRGAALARRTRRKAERIARALSALEDERSVLLRYQEFFRAFEPLFGSELAWPDGRAFYVVLRAGADDAVHRLRASLDAAVDGEIEVLSRPLPSGETAVLILVSAAAAPKVGQLLSASRVQELPAPEGLGEGGLLRAMPALRARLAEIPKASAALEEERRVLREEVQEELLSLRAHLHDVLLMLDARSQAHTGPHLFVIEGWLPGRQIDELTARAQRELGSEVLVEAVTTEPWSRVDAPVALANPPLFRPFEVITRTLPLPRYGTIDPTPFVAVFFPMFVGLMLGDVGFGALLAVLAIVLRVRSKPRSTLRSISAVAGACAAFTAVFGLLFGELFGDLGARLFRMRPLGFDRQEAIMPFLALTLALGVVHVVLGLTLAVVNAWRQGRKREAFGRGIAALMVTLSVMALLAALRFLPSALFTPLVIAVLVAFPVLVLLEGVIAVIELVSNFGQILSYARIMALGTASLMLAVVANRMVGAMGSALVGVLFALLFHIVNFAIGLFSPTIHALRLHYVEFFGRFFSPGGIAYRPLAHWHPSEQGS
ncbi:MAG: V-type ATP synthase subunit I [Polyangiaceae bacterium]